MSKRGDEDSNETTISYSGEKPKRKLTSFLCREMLYDYELGTLDEDRRAAVDAFIRMDPECQLMLEGVRRGLKYTEALSHTQLKAEVALHIGESENVVSLGRRYSSWSEWPAELRWTTVFVALSLVLAGAVTVIPWSKIKALHAPKTDTLQLAELQKPADPNAVVEKQEGDATSEQGSGDEEIEAPDESNDDAPPAKPPEKSSAKTVVAGLSAISGKPTPPSKTVQAADESEDNSGDEGDEADATPSAKHAAAAPPPVEPVPVATAVPTVAKVAAVAPAVGGQDQTGEGPTKADIKQAAAESAAGGKEAKAKGFVYRAFMNLHELDDVGPKIAEQITELGGSKAGEVELGWKRGTGRYYHFVMPEENEEKLLEKLRAYGPVRISKDPHPRVMPQGQVRFILWVESTH